MSRVMSAASFLGWQLKCLLVTLLYATVALANADVIWVEDATPTGATLAGTNEGWTWITANVNPVPFSGDRAHQSKLVNGVHQHYFSATPAANQLSVNAGDTLFAYVYLDPANPPSEVMLQWNDGNWNHRAYWGSNNITWGVNGTASRRYMGPLPAAGQWVRLEVPANAVGLEGRSLNGMAFTLYNGRATWDQAGKVSAGSGNVAPSINNLTASPQTLFDNATSQLQVSASDPDADPGATGSAALTYTWSIVSGGGSLSSTTIANPVYTPANISQSTSVTINVVVSDGAASANQNIVLTVNDAGAPLAISTIELAAGTVGSAYSQTLTATGGITPYTWSIAQGSLPAGMSLATNGTLSGTPSAAGTSSVTVRVTDVNGRTLTKALSITVNARSNVAPSINNLTASPQTLFDNATSQLQVSASDPDADPGATGSAALTYTWSIVSGGGSLSSTTIANPVYTPPNVGTSTPVTLNVVVSDGAASANQNIVLTVNDAGAPLAISTIELAAGTVGSAYNQTLAATGGVTPYTWSIATGSLPAGIGLATNGTLTGTPSAAGTSSFTVRVTDVNGATLTKALSITVNAPANVAPTVSITAPVNGATYIAPAAISLGANATDNDGTISKVEFYNGATLLDTDISSPYTLSLSNVAAGSYAYTAKATDNSGAVTTSAVVNVTVGTNAAPTVSLTAPANGASYQLPATVNLTAAASDSDGTLAKVEFYNGATLLGTDTTSPYNYAWANPGVGSHSLTAKAYDNLGAVTTSSVVSITVTAANVAPSISSLTATPQTLLDNATSQLQVTASDPDSGPATLSYTWSIVSGGGSLSSTTIANPVYTPPNVSTSTPVTLNVVVSDGAASANQNIVVTVNDAGAPIAISTTSLAAGTVGSPYNQTLTATGGVTPHTWSIAEGSLPAGISLATNGALTGTPSAAGTSSFTVRVTDVNGGIADRALTLSITSPVEGGSPLLNWSLNDGSGIIASDSSGGGNHGSISGGATWVPGRVGGALNLDGGSGMVALPSVSGLASGNTPHTIAAWVKVNALPNNRAWILLLGPEAGGSHHWLLSNTGGTGFGVWNGSQVSPVLPVGQWKHVAIIFDGTTLTGYVDGVSIGSQAATFNLQGTSLTIAQRHNGENYFNGAVDDVRIYSRALSATEVVTLAEVSANTPPTVNLVAPTDDASYTTPATITLTANAADSDGTISNVEFYNGTNLLNTDNASPYTYDWTGVAAGSYALTAKAYDNLGAVTTSSGVNITVTAANVAPSISSVSATPQTVLDNATSQLQVTANDPDAGPAALSYTWSIVSGGGSLSSTTIANPVYTPPNVGTSTPVTLNVVVSDGAASANQNIVVTVNDAGAPIAISTTSLAAGTVGSAYNQTLAATGGVTPYTWSIATGSLPAGIGLATNGTLTGTPSAAGTSSFTVRVTDVNGATLTKALSITVNAPANVAPSISSVSATPQTVLDNATSQLQITANDPDAGPAALSYTWSIVSGGGSLSSTTIANPVYTPPNVSTSTPVTLNVVVSDGAASANQNIVVTVNDAGAPIAISTTSLAAGTVGSAYNQTLAATGGVTPYTWSIATGNLPAGISLATNGTLTGTPSAASTSSFTVRVTDVNETTLTRDLSIAISANPPPTVNLIAPTDNATYLAPATIILGAEASDSNGTIQRVEFYKGSDLLHTDLDEPYGFVWANVDVGTHILSAKAFDNLNDVSTSNTVTIVVSTPANQLPTIELLSPAVGALYNAPASIDFSANAIDPDGNVANVEFYSNGTLVGSTAQQPFAFNWTNVTAGNYSITAKVYDDKGGTATSNPVSIVVNALPTVELTAPVSSIYSTPPTMITLSATAADPEGPLEKVDFYDGASLLNTDNAAPYTYDWPTPPAGVHSLTAHAHDNSGGISISSPVTVVVNALPQIDLIAPANNATYIAPAEITLEAKATDTGGTISKVEFYNGSTLLNTDELAPYSYKWSDVPVGSHTLSAKAYDNNGAVVVSLEHTVTVNPPNQLPSVSLTDPINNASYTAPASITLNASATDNDGGITKVEFYNGTAKLSEDTVAPYSFDWNNVVAGTYALTARAYDVSGGESISTVVNVVAAPPNTPPTVNIVSPVNNDNFLAPGTIIINVNASDADGSITKVEFYNGQTKIGEDPTAPYSFTWSSVSAGTYRLTARAYDNVGEAQTSNEVQVTVSSGGKNVPPLAILLSPVQGATYSAPAAIRIQALVEDTAGGVVTGLQLYINDSLYNSVPNPATNTIWNISGFPAGAWRFKVKATDNQGAVTESNSATVNVYAPVSGNAPPTVSLQLPISNAAFLVGTPFLMQASASDLGGSINRVDFYIGSVYLGTSLAPPYALVVRGSLLPAGNNYVLTARAYDNFGVYADSTKNISVFNYDPANALPSVLLTSPNNGMTYTAPADFKIAATATDSNGINRVEVGVNGRLFAVMDASPYEIDLTGVGPGTYIFEVIAYDNLGAGKRSNAATVTVNGPPSVSITSPSAAQTFHAPASIPIEVTAADPGGSIVKVEFYADSTYLGDDSTEPFTYSWAGATPGAHTLTAKAYDNAGAVTTSAEVTVNVNASPIVTLTSPVDKSTYTYPMNIGLAANAWDTDGSITKVEFYDGVTLIETDTSAPFSYNWVNAPPGIHSLTAKAYDTSGGITISTPVVITISATPTPTTYQYDEMGRLIGVQH